jgi:hypothetical protein
VGGIIWMVDYKIPFIAGVAFAAVSLGLTQLIPRIRHWEGQ